MQTISYHAFSDAHQNTVLACNLCSDKRPLLVNCAGSTFIKWTFHTKNTQGRKDYYLLYLKTGTLTFSVSGERHTLTSGTLILLPPDYPYEYFQTGEAPLFYYWIHFTGSHVQSLLDEYALLPLPLFRSLPQASVMLEYQMQKMFDIFIKNDTFRDAALSHCMDAILLELAKHSYKPGDETKRLSKSIKHINNCYTSDLNVPELAAMEFLSVSRFNVLFKRLMKISPYQYIIQLRINAACEMLRDSKLSVSQIAELVGFQNVFFFSKLFKKHMKMSPLRYRQNEANTTEANPRS